MLNRQLVQVGRLLAGIIHEIRGPLSVIRGSAELLRLGRQPDDPDLPWVDSILRGTQVLQVRLDHLMATVRAGPPQLQALDLPPVIHEAVDLFVKGLPPQNRGVRIQVDCDRAVPRVHADAGRLIQVLINLLTNAHQAITRDGKEGVIHLRAGTRRGSRELLGQDPRQDDGPGIPEIYLARIFEPFFTTKEGGSGYGLYLCSEILGEQGGRLTACNNPAEGPVSRSGCREKPGRAPRPPWASRQSERETRPGISCYRVSIPGSRKAAGRIGHG